MTTQEVHAAERLASVWGDGYLAGLADMQNGEERDNPYRPAHTKEPS